MISIIVPLYNAAEYIEKTIEMVCRQTYKDWELILVDDGSRDGSLNVLREYEKKDTRLKVIHQENAGVSVARNNAMKEALGQFMTFVDGDDMIAEDSLANIEQIIIKNNFFKISFSNVNFSTYFCE